MGTEIFDMASVSSRGQVAIPAEIRKSMKLEEGSKVIFFLENDTVWMKKASAESFAELTRPFREAAKKSGLKESDVPGIISRFRKSKK